jgi:hypothetical protein
MSLKQTVSEFVQSGQPPDVEGFLAERPVLAAALTPLSVVVAVAVGGVFAGMSLTNILICALVAGGGVALFRAMAAWLFDAPMRRGLLGLWDESGDPRPIRFKRSRHPGRPAPAHPSTRSNSTSRRDLVATGGAPKPPRGDARRALQE